MQYYTKKKLEKYENIVEELNDLLKQLRLFTLQSAQYNISLIDGWTKDFVEELFKVVAERVTVYRKSQIKSDELLNNLEKLAKYLIGYALIIRYHAFRSPTVGLDRHQIINIIRQLNEYLFNNYFAVLFDAINNINISKYINKLLKRELRRISSKHRYSPLRDSETREIIKKVSLDDQYIITLLEDIVQTFIVGDKEYKRLSDKLISTFNDLEQVILNFIATIILLKDIEAKLKTKNLLDEFQCGLTFK